MGGTSDGSAARATPERAHLVQLHVAVALFGGAALFGKLIDLAPGALVAARSGVAAMAVAAVIAAGAARRSRTGVARGTPASPAWPSIRQGGSMVGLGVVLAAHWFAFFRSVQTSTVSIAVLTTATFPLFVALLGPLAARSRPRLADVGLAGLAVLGVSALVDPDGLAAGGGGGASAAGAGWGVLAAVLFAVLALGNETLVATLPSPTVALGQYATAAVVLAPSQAGVLAAADAGQWLRLVVLGVVFTAVAHTLFIQSMASVSAVTASLAASLEPVYGVGLAWLVVAEQPTIRIVAGGLVILTAVGLGHRHRR